MAWCSTAHGRFDENLVYVVVTALWIAVGAAARRREAAPEPTLLATPNYAVG